MIRLIDTHCHVHFSAYKDDMEQVITRSLEAGIGMVTVGTQSTTSKGAVEIANRFEGVWASIGLHPSHLHKQEFYDSDELPPESQGTKKIKTREEEFDTDLYRELAQNKKVVAIGEFGLDYYRIPPGVEREQMITDQKASAKAHLKLANEVGLPVIIHSRDSFEDQFEMIESCISGGGLKRRGVVHCFSGSTEEARSYREIGFMVGIGGIITFSKNLQNAVRDIPLDQILLETDAPYLAPEPMRGKRNEPQYVEFVAKKIAEIKEISLDEVAQTTTFNASRLFNLNY